MSFRRFENPKPLAPEEKVELLRNYFVYYRDLAETELSALNANLARSAHVEMLEAIGELLLETSRLAATQQGPVRDFLDDNPLPPVLSQRLPNEFRAFCLALNALKQWLSAEQAYTDRYLLGGRARDYCRQAATYCLVTKEPFDGQLAELHHPVRDGRPPLLLSKQGHSAVHGQQKGGANKTNGANQSNRASTDFDRGALIELKHRGNRSWVQLRLGCESHLGLPLSFRKPQTVVATGRSFATQAAVITGKSYRQLLSWLDEEGLAIP